LNKNTATQGIIPAEDQERESSSVENSGIEESKNFRKG
jgi:hypothetical protein